MLISNNNNILTTLCLHNFVTIYIFPLLAYWYKLLFQWTVSLIWLLVFTSCVSLGVMLVISQPVLWRFHMLEVSALHLWYIWQSTLESFQMTHLLHVSEYTWICMELSVNINAWFCFITILGLLHYAWGENEGSSKYINE